MKRSMKNETRGTSERGTAREGRGASRSAARRFLALLTVATLLFTLTSCSAAKNLLGGALKTMQAARAAHTQRGVTITATAAKAAQTELYECADFSMTVPQGWQVSAGGVNIYHSIRVYDPDEPLNQMFVQLKAEPLLHSREGKAAWQYSYDAGNVQAWLFAEAPVMQNPSTEGFYQIQPQYADHVSGDVSFAGYDFPRFEDFTVTERFTSVSSMQSYASGDELLRASFTDDGKEGEGLFCASVVDFGSVPIWSGSIGAYGMEAVDGGYYMAYNIVAVTAAKDTFLEWESLLVSCLQTLQYSESFVNATVRASSESVAQATQFSQNVNQIMDGMMSSWESRNTSQDILSQKQSDATLGYERVYDTQTGETYRATNGWYDSYRNEGERYQMVTDDQMYTEPISGYIE